MMPHPLSAQEKLDWLRLIRSENVGPMTFRLLLQRYGDVKSALQALPDLAARGGKKSLKPCSVADAEKELEHTEKYGARLLASCEPDYPAFLRTIEDYPPLIAVYGHAHILAKDGVAIVGARNASLNGKKLAERIAQGLGQRGYIVTSGLARGIDTAAHHASITTGTIAVVAGGIDTIYPEENTALYKQIADCGCVVAEMPFGSVPRAQHFPRRNRIISGLSLGTVVIEAAKQSGSLITARMAGEQGREVFAVPGSPLDPRCEGSNDLLKQGATLVDNADDIARHLLRRPVTLAEPTYNEFTLPMMQINDADLAAARSMVLENLSPAPVGVDELIRHCALPAAAVLTVLLELELAGQLQWLPGQKVMLVGQINSAVA